MNGLRNRGVEDVLIASVDGLTGFSSAIEAVFLQAEIQQCIVHQIRKPPGLFLTRNIKTLMADLKKVYAAIDEQIALYELDNFEEKWSAKYPKIAISWRTNWANLSTYFKYPEEVRKLIYTTNAIEGINRQLCKVSKSKSVFPTDDSYHNIHTVFEIVNNRSGYLGKFSREIMSKATSVNKCSTVI